MNLVIVLQSVHGVMRAEKLLKSRGLRVDIVPIPREISSDCGVAIELPKETEKEALSLIEHHGFSGYECYWKLEGGKFKKREG